MRNDTTFYSKYAALAAENLRLFNLLNEIGKEAPGYLDIREKWLSVDQKMRDAYNQCMTPAGIVCECGDTMTKSPLDHPTYYCGCGKESVLR